MQLIKDARRSFACQRQIISNNICCTCGGVAFLVFCSFTWFDSRGIRYVWCERNAVCNKNTKQKPQKMRNKNTSHMFKVLAPLIASCVLPTLSCWACFPFFTRFHSFSFHFSRTQIREHMFAHPLQFRCFAAASGSDYLMAYALFCALAPMQTNEHILLRSRVYAMRFPWPSHSPHQPIDSWLLLFKIMLECVESKEPTRWPYFRYSIQLKTNIHLFSAFFHLNFYFKFPKHPLIIR